MSVMTCSLTPTIPQEGLMIQTVLNWRVLEALDPSDYLGNRVVNYSQKKSPKSPFQKRQTECTVVERNV